jgi:outer membrane lipoprotein LolB
MFTRLAQLVRLSVLLTLAACATVPKPVGCPLPGKEVETLQSPVTVSVKAGDQSMGGRGYLIYKRPDRFHLVLLSPFGLTLFELFTDGERLTCIIPSRDRVYSGLASDLPQDNPLKSWSLMRWVAELPPPAGPVPGTIPCRTANGGNDLISYDRQGLIKKKESPEGDRVFYSDYTEKNGVAIPGTVELHDRNGYRVRIVFDEPEINLPLDEALLTPNLEGVTPLPLDSFREM